MAVLVGKPAPDFKATAVRQGKTFDLTLSQFKDQRYVVLFFYPLDFTFVCPTELHEFQAQLSAFEALGVEVIGCSTDSHFSHAAWLNTPKNKGGIEGVQYSLVADFTKEIAAAYDVLLPGGMALRGTFIIDKAGVVQSQVVNNLPLGRSIGETLRTVEALQFTEKHGEVCPANWNKGAKSMKPTQEGLETFFAA